ncbi:25615_t:CDS:2, partial [Dentiscutata erythropus]
NSLILPSFVKKFLKKLNMSQYYTNSNSTLPGEVICRPGTTGNGTCMCDWRVQIRDCPSEGTFIENLYLVNTLACFIVFIMLTGLLIWRMAVKGQGLISKDPLKEMGILRPKPLECFLLLNIFHVAFRLLYSVCLISDFLPLNVLKELIHDVTFTISLASLAIYLIGLIYTIPRTHIAAQRAVISGYGKASSSKLKNLEFGLKKLRRVRVLLLSDLFFFAIASLVFALCRNFILTYSPALSLILATCWILIVPLTNAVIITVLAYEINEKAKMPPLRPKTTTFNQSRSNEYYTANAVPKYPGKTVKNDRNYPNDSKGITVRFEQTIEQTISNSSIPFSPDSKALEREQDFVGSASDQSHSAIVSEGESSDSIELVW